MNSSNYKILLKLIIECCHLLISFKGRVEQQPLSANSKSNKKIIKCETPISTFYKCPYPYGKLNIVALPSHSIWDGAKDPLHHCQMFTIIVCLKERDAQI